MKKMALLTAVMLILFAIPLMSWAGSVPIPSDIKITPPDPNLPAEVKAFFGTSGKWKGDWHSVNQWGVPAVLIVERISAQTIQFVYCWGGSQPGSRRYYLSFERKDGEISFSWSTYYRHSEYTAVFNFLVKNGKLEGVYRLSGGRVEDYFVTMKPIE